VTVKKNILFITGHPAQIHNFKFVKAELERMGHRTYWLAVEKDISKKLLEAYDIQYQLLYLHKKTSFSKLVTLIRNTCTVFTFLKKYKINLVVSRVSPYASVATFLLRLDHIGLIDTESSGFYNSFFSRLISVLLSARSYTEDLRFDQVRFDGNIELCYLHPNRFKPKPTISDILPVNPGEPFVLLRFVSWDAHHDRGLTGLTFENKVYAVKEFSKYAKIFISAEMELPAELKQYQIQIPPEKIHDVLAHASLFFGEAATMASESVLLGTPAIYLNENWLGYTEEEKKFGLLFSYKESLLDQKNAIEKGISLLQDSDFKSKIIDRRKKFLETKIDVTAFLVWFIDAFPQSFKIMKANPDYQQQFK
jgi:uncharacterized protein